MSPASRATPLEPVINVSRRTMENVPLSANDTTPLN